MLRDKDRSILILTIICIFLQIAIAPNIPIAGVIANLLLIPMVAIAIRYGPREGCIYGFVFGLICDLSSTGPMGAMMLVMCIMGFVVGSTANSVPLESWISCLLVLLISATLTEFARAVFISMVSSGIELGPSLIHIMLPALFYDAAFGLIAFPILGNRITRGNRASIARESTSGMHVDVSNISLHDPSAGQAATQHRPKDSE